MFGTPFDSGAFGWTVDYRLCCGAACARGLGYWKNHLTEWVDIYCGEATDPTCGELLDALTCKGSDARCGRSDAAAFLNALTGCTE